MLSLALKIKVTGSEPLSLKVKFLQVVRYPLLANPAETESLISSFFLQTFSPAFGFGSNELEFQIMFHLFVNIHI